MQFFAYNNNGDILLSYPKSSHFLSTDSTSMSENTCIIPYHAVATHQE